MSNEIITVPALVSLADWQGSAQRGLAAREGREKIIASVLKPGLDFGVIPGTNDKPTLLKAGAEKIADALNLYPDYEPVKITEDFDRPLFYFRYKCLLRQRGTDSIVATGIGSCNSMEAKYRWRNAMRKCPACGKETIIKRKAEKGGGYMCLGNEKGGCWSKFAEDDQRILGQPAGKVENDDIYSQINTIDKMSQKRAMIAAALNLGFSEQFTQDLDDHLQDQPEPQPQQKKQPPTKQQTKPAVSQQDPLKLTKEQWEEIKSAAVQNGCMVRKILDYYKVQRPSELMGSAFQDCLGKIKLGHFRDAEAKPAEHPRTADPSIIDEIYMTIEQGQVTDEATIAAGQRAGIKEIPKSLEALTDAQARLLLNELRKLTAPVGSVQ